MIQHSAFTLFENPEERAELIAPIERILLPASLDGSATWTTPWIPDEPALFKNDIEAIRGWLSSYPKKRMRNACRTALEKILLWCVVERGHSLAELTSDEVGLFCQFLLDVEPRHRWISHTADHRSSPTWRPFKATLGAQAARLTLMLINVYFRWASENGLYLRGQPLYGLALALKKERSAMTTSNQPITLQRLSIEGWLALRQFLPSNPDSFKDLQVLSFHQLQYYGAVNKAQIAALRVKDFIAHQKHGEIVAWEFPAGNARQSTVFSVSPLTETITQLLEKIPARQGISVSETLVFDRSLIRAANSFRRAKAQAILYFQNAGEIGRATSMASLTPIQLRGAIIDNAHREAAEINLAPVFTWIYFKKYPNTNRYMDQSLQDDVEKRLQGAVRLSAWIHQTETK